MTVTDNDDHEATIEAAAIEKGRLFFARPWVFALSVKDIPGLPDRAQLEVAFAGRSNVGKSSLINALIGVKGLARTSNTPGRTQFLNYFVPQDTPATPLAIVDMPGYGYAKAPMPLVEQWTDLVMRYLRGRTNLRRVYVLIDSRHGLKKNDTEVLDMLDKVAVSYQIVLTKIDKIKASALEQVFLDVESALKRRPAAYPQIIATSSEKGEGIAHLRAAIAALV